VKIAIAIYDRMTLLDAIGPAEVLELASRRRSEPSVG